MTTGASVFKDKVSINMAATMDPYGVDENNTRINTFHIKNGGGLARFTSANMNISFSLSNKDFEKEEEEDEEDEEEDDEFTKSDYERLSGGGRDDDLFGVSNNFADNRFQEKLRRERRRRRAWIFIQNNNALEYEVCSFLNLQQLKRSGRNIYELTNDFRKY